jgi:hypothetical protein
MSGVSDSSAAAADLDAVLVHGTYYMPAAKHYWTFFGPKKGDIVVCCDNCNATNLVACIGYKTNDLCLPCVESLTKAKSAMVGAPVLAPVLASAPAPVSPPTISFITPPPASIQKLINELVGMTVEDARALVKRHGFTLWAGTMEDLAKQPEVFRANQIQAITDASRTIITQASLDSFMAALK